MGEENGCKVCTGAVPELTSKTAKRERELEEALDSADLYDGDPTDDFEPANDEEVNVVGLVGGVSVVGVIPIKWSYTVRFWYLSNLHMYSQQTILPCQERTKLKISIIST